MTEDLKRHQEKIHGGTNKLPKIRMNSTKLGAQWNIVTSPWAHYSDALLSSEKHIVTSPTLQRPGNATMQNINLYDIYAF
jgi:hypothetical protein